MAVAKDKSGQMASTRQLIVQEENNGARQEDNMLEEYKSAHVWRPIFTRRLNYCAFALNLIFEFQTFFAPENCAQSKVLATSPYAGSSVLYGDVVIFTMRRLSHDEKRSDNRKSFVWGIRDFFACAILLGLTFTFFL